MSSSPLQLRDDTNLAKCKTLLSTKCGVKQQSIRKENYYCILNIAFEYEKNTQYHPITFQKH